MSDLAERLADILRRTPRLIEVMTTVRALDLPDWLVFSGAIYQPVWNHLTGRPLEHGLKDYDLAYFDAGDLSWEAEDAVIRRVAAAFAAPLGDLVEVRNQARVHLWFEAHFGEAYAPLASSAEAVGRFTATAFAVGARLDADGELILVAPFGLDDLFAMRLRPNPSRPTAAFAHTAERAKARWPELTIET
jgi:hypothetical protein